MSHPLYSQRNSVSGEDYEQCGPMFRNRLDFGGTYLFWAEGQRPNRELPDATGGIALLNVRRQEIAENGGHGTAHFASSRTD
jgi:hypothetical protein